MRGAAWLVHVPVLAFSAAMLAGCASEPAVIPIYEERGDWIGVKFDPAAKPGHSHPHAFTPVQIGKALRGVTVTPRDTIIGFLKREPRPAFTAEQIARLTPYFVQAFKKASPQDSVVFSLTTADARLGPLITSGGLSVRGTRLYLILANYLTPPSAGPFEGTAYELDVRDDPLMPIARYRFLVDFVPEAARIPNQEADKLDPYRSNTDLSKRVVVELSRLFSESPPLTSPEH